jgi:hypothetical protein
MDFKDTVAESQEVHWFITPGRRQIVADLSIQVQQQKPMTLTVSGVIAASDQVGSTGRGQCHDHNDE